MIAPQPYPAYQRRQGFYKFKSAISRLLNYVKTPVELLVSKHSHGYTITNAHSPTVDAYALELDLYSTSLHRSEEYATHPVRITVMVSGGSPATMRAVQHSGYGGGKCGAQGHIRTQHLFALLSTLNVFGLNDSFGLIFGHERRQLPNSFNLKKEVAKLNS